MAATLGIPGEWQWWNYVLSFTGIAGMFATGLWIWLTSSFTRPDKKLLGKVSAIAREAGKMLILFVYMFALLAALPLGISMLAPYEVFVMMRLLYIVFGCVTLVWALESLVLRTRATERGTLLLVIGTVMISMIEIMPYWRDKYAALSE